MRAGAPATNGAGPSEVRGTGGRQATRSWRPASHRSSFLGSFVEDDVPTVVSPTRHGHVLTPPTYSSQLVTAGGSPSTSPSALSASPAQAASLSTSVEDTKGEAEAAEFAKGLLAKGLEHLVADSPAEVEVAKTKAAGEASIAAAAAAAAAAVTEEPQAMDLQPVELELDDMMKVANPEGSGHTDFGEFVVTVGEQSNMGGKFADVYQKALDAVNEASKEGANWVKGLNPLVAAAQLAKAKQPARRAFLGAPTHGSYALVAEMGTPPDADCSERARDKVLGFFIAQNTLFMVLAGISALVIVGFGVAIGVFLLSAIIGAEIFTLTDIYPECANKTHSIELYLERNPGKFWTERDGVYAPATHNKVDRVFGQGMHKVCTDGQLWFNICIKVFTISFSYINLLPVPWRFAILCDAYDTDKRNKGQVGVDFYGRPTEALWFHLPVHTRKIVAWCLNIGYVAHYVSLGTHIYYWEYWDTQGMPGAPAVNIPFIISIVVPIIGAQFQGAAEKTVMKANPKRFPPTFDEYLAKAKADYAEDLRTGKATRLGCGLGFLKHVLKAQEQMKKDQLEFETLSGIKSSNMAGIMLTKDSESPSPKKVVVPNAPPPSTADAV